MYVVWGTISVLSYLCLERQQRAVERIFRQVPTARIEVLEITKGRVWGSYPIMR